MKIPGPKALNIPVNGLFIYPNSVGGPGFPTALKLCFWNGSVSIEHEWRMFDAHEEMLDFVKAICVVAVHDPDVNDQTLMWAAELYLNPIQIMDQTWRTTWHKRRLNVSF